MKVRVDAARCTGHGRCYDLAPEIFGEDEEGHCVLLVSEPAPEQLDDARRAADNCPERAIQLDAAG